MLPRSRDTVVEGPTHAVWLKSVFLPVIWLWLATLPCLAQTAGPTGSAVTGLMIAPTNPSTIYANGSRQFRSTNGGASWVEVPGAYKVIAADPSNPVVVYRGTQGPPGGTPLVRSMDSIYKSIDSGSRWIPSGDKLEYSLSFTRVQSYIVTAIAIDPTNSATLYIAVATDGNQFGPSSTRASMPA